MSTATRDVVCKQTLAGTIEVSEETAARLGLSREEQWERFGREEFGKFAETQQRYDREHESKVATLTDAGISLNDDVTPKPPAILAATPNAYQPDPFTPTAGNVRFEWERGRIGVKCIMEDYTNDLRMLFAVIRADMRHRGLIGR